MGINIAYTVPSVELLQKLSPEQAWHYMIIPKAIQGKEMTFYSVDSSDNLKEELEMVLGFSVVLELITNEDLKKLLSRHYRKNHQSETKKLDYSGNNNFLENLISEAKNLESSDIHIESYEERCRVRLRIDGKLMERYVIDKVDYPALVNKIKVMSSLDIAEKRLPQDGRIYFEKGYLKFDIRVSVLPTLYGEKVVLRLLNKDATNVDIKTLGIEGNDLKNFMEAIRKPNGIILISGPTGSGKTTTLYATLKQLNDESRNITTIEDPIEYTLEGINQVQLKENIGLDFASSMRTFLRQDPDVIMVGEIRDPATANMAIRASLTGHLVMSTIHTNSAWGIISRLIDMDIPPYLVANTLNSAIAQRLVRVLCENCKEEVILNDSSYPSSFTAPIKLKNHYQACGCNECHHTGYKGRKAIYEVVNIDKELAEAIRQNKSGVSELLEERGITTLSESAFRLFEKGKTSLEEVYPLLTNF